MRPSCVNTIRPVESMSSRPAGASPRRWLGLNLCRRRIVGPAILRLDQHHGRRVAVLGLARDVADRLVEQDRHLLALMLRAPRGRSRCARAATPARQAWRPPRRRPSPSLSRSIRRLRGANTGPVRSSVSTAAGRRDFRGEETRWRVHSARRHRAERDDVDAGEAASRVSTPSAVRRMRVFPARCVRRWQ